MCLTDHSRVDAVTDIRLTGILIWPSRLPGKSAVCNSKAIKKPAWIPRSVIKFWNEENIYARATKIVLEVLRPTSIRIRGAECERSAVKRAHKGFAVIQIVVFVSKVLLEKGQELRRVSEMCHVEAEKEFEVCPLAGVEE
jgi:hypothetical protein